MTARLEFAILGPVEVRLDGASVRIGGRRQRALLAMLLCHANHVVSRDRLIDELLGDQPADSADRTLRVQVSRLRKALAVAGDEDRLLGRPPGYVLRVEAGELDLDAFERLVGEGRQALERDEGSRAVARFREAESLWRGRPLADVEFEPFARLEVERLEELRLSALEDRIDAEVALRRPGLVPELEALVAGHPLRERLRAQLMRALYADARQADALAVYADTRRLLVEELGIEPGEELRELERMVLDHDPELGRRSAPPRSPPAREAGQDMLRGRRFAAIVATILASAFIALLIASGGTSSGGLAGIRVPAVALLDASSGKLVGQVPGDTLGIIRSGAGSIWDLQQSGVIQQIDARTLRLTRSVPLGDIGAGSDIAIGEGAAWVTERSRAVARIDARYGSVSRIRLPQRGLSRPGATGGIAIGAGSLWVAQGQSRVLRVDPATGRVQRSFDVPDAMVVAFGDGAAWVASSDLGGLTKIDARTDTIAATARIGPWICCVAIGGGYVWAANNAGIVKLSLAGDPLRTLSTPSQTGGISFGADGLWVASDTAGTVTRIDAHDEHEVRYRLGHLLIGLGVSGHLVAVAAAPVPTDLLSGVKGRVLHVTYTSVWPDSTDPAVAGVPGRGNWVQEEQLQSATCARLLTPGARGPVPEIAAAAPTVSPDGRTYAFRISGRYRFSPPSGVAVTAADLKYSIERALSPRLGMNAPAIGLVPDIAGLHAYRARRATHISGITATGDVLSIRLLRRAPDFPDRIAASYFCPVPIGTPLGSPSSVTEGLNAPIPSAGPYYLSGDIGGGLAVLKRNPNYTGPRPTHLDAFVYRQHDRLGDAVDRVVSGTEDYAAERGDPMAATGPIARRFAKGQSSVRRYFLTPLLGTDELVFNPHSRLFQSARVRRAVSLALDRPKLAAALGDVVTDRVVPTGIAGSPGAHVYPLDGPDLHRARALMARRGRRARLVVCSEPACARLGSAARANLRRIGIHVQLRRYAGDIGPLMPRRHGDLTLARVMAPYPDPAAFLRRALGDAAPRARLRRIARMDRPQRILAAARLEVQELRGSTPVVAFGTPAIPELFSGRVGCKTFSPVAPGVELSVLCLQR